VGQQADVGLARALATLFLAGIVACGSSPAPGQPEPIDKAGQPAPVRVLVFTATAGFRHDAIGAARDTLSALAAGTGEFTATMSERVADLEAGPLAAVDVVVFALTSGELPLTDGQKAALFEFVNRGGGFIGIHSATDTLYGWPDYGRLVGAYFQAHPWTETARVTVEDRAHPTTASLGASFELLEEFYTFRENPRPSVHVLLSLDAASVGASGDYPLAWTQTIGAGRTYYNALGHFAATWDDPRFQIQIREAIRWAARR
jgi:type 1 glutamine amidotransferase